MKVYIGDSDVRHTELYDLLMKSKTLSLCTFVYKKDINNEKELLKNCDVMIADISYPTIPLGIELGWADIYDVDIICVCVKGTAISSHLTRMSKDILTYTDSTDMVEKLEWLFKNKYHIKTV